jgi:uncharacterized phage-associated protein
MAEIIPTTQRQNDVILRVLAGVGRPIASTQLVKLVYLVDYTYHQHYGETLSGFEYEWDHFGPNALGHGIIKHAEHLAESECQIKRTEEPNIYGGQTNKFRFMPSSECPNLGIEGEMVINDILAQYGRLSVRSVTKVSKQTAPFEHIPQYSSIQMEHHIPVHRLEEGEWDRHVEEVEQEGTVSLDELIDEYEWV